MSNSGSNNAVPSATAASVTAAVKKVRRTQEQILANYVAQVEAKKKADEDKAMKALEKLKKEMEEKEAAKAIKNAQKKKDADKKAIEAAAKKARANVEKLWKGVSTKMNKNREASFLANFKKSQTRRRARPQSF